MLSTTLNEETTHKLLRAVNGKKVDTPTQDCMRKDHVISDTMIEILKNHIFTRENSYKMLSEQVYVPE